MPDKLSLTPRCLRFRVRKRAIAGVIVMTFAFVVGQAAVGEDAIAQSPAEPSLRVATLNVPAIVPIPPVVVREAQPQDSEARARLNAALAYKIDAEYFNTSLGDVLNDLSTQAEIPIILDQAATSRFKYRIHSQLTVTVFEAPVIFNVKAMPLANVLDLILPGLGLTWGTRTNELSV